MSTDEEVLLRRTRTDGFWRRALRRRPVATTAVLLGPFAVTAVLQWGSRQLAGGLGLFPSLVAGWLLLRPFRRRLARSMTAFDDAEGLGPGREPVDVRGTTPVPPEFGPGTPAAEHLRTVRLAWLLVVGGSGLLVGASDLVRGWPRPPASTFGYATGGVAAALLLGVLHTLRVRRSFGRFLARDLAPRPVRVLGLRDTDGAWLLEPLDDGPRCAVRPSWGDDLLVAGDVLHAWGDVDPLDRPAGSDAAPRLALTGPFGTVWTPLVRAAGP